VKKGATRWLSAKRRKKSTRLGRRERKKKTAARRTVNPSERDYLKKKKVGSRSRRPRRGKERGRKKAWTLAVITITFNSGKGDAAPEEGRYTSSRRKKGGERKSREAELVPLLLNKKLVSSVPERGSSVSSSGEREKDGRHEVQKNELFLKSSLNHTRGRSRLGERGRDRLCPVRGKCSTY